MVHAPGPQSMVITQNVPMQQQVKAKLISYKIDMKAKVTMIILLLLFLLKTCMITLAEKCTFFVYCQWDPGAWPKGSHAKHMLPTHMNSTQRKWKWHDYHVKVTMIMDLRNKYPPQAPVAYPQQSYTMPPPQPQYPPYGPPPQVGWWYSGQENAKNWICNGKPNGL